MKNLIFLSLVLLFCSCDEGSPETMITEKDKIIDFHVVFVSDSLQPLVDSLNLFNEIDDEAAVYEGIKSDIYLCFEKFMQTATDDELLRLTDHNSPVIRGYSFWTLVEKENSKVKQIMLNHVDDTAMVSRMSGCLVFPQRLNDFLFSIIAPNCVDADCSRLPKEDIAEIKSKMK